MRLVKVSNAVSKVEYRESETVELLELVLDEIKKKVVVLANSNGGLVQRTFTH